MAVTVNGEMVDDGRFHRAFLKLSGGVTPEVVQRADPVRRQAWQRMAEQEVLERVVLVQAAHVEGVQVTSAEVEQERRKTWGSDAYLVCGAGLRADLEEALLCRKMEAHVTRHVPRPSQGEVQAAYQQRTRQYTQPARVHAHQLIYQAETAAERKTALIAMDQVMRELGRGKSMPQLAAKPEGGLVFSDLSWVRAGDLVTELEEALSKLRAGQVSEPVQTVFGIHVLKVIARHDARVEPFPDVKQALARSMWDERRCAVRAQVLHELLRRADVQVLTPGRNDEQGATA